MNSVNHGVGTHEIVRSHSVKLTVKKGNVFNKQEAHWPYIAHLKNSFCIILYWNFYLWNSNNIVKYFKILQYIKQYIKVDFLGIILRSKDAWCINWPILCLNYNFYTHFAHITWGKTSDLDEERWWMLAKKT